ncbi:alanine racemase [Marinilactibacillus piezotolerans]|uniref:alanine racemase n=1 Tax=Marinilactibacillus piezotolerans TaxID=258723 RepID=UPI0009B08A93|nr:alanine racemase [Marinilactibacillus piezotolerans]
MEYGSYRFTRAEVNLDHMEYNVDQIKKQLNPETKFMAVVKADAYGHGAVEIGRKLEAIGTDYLAVAVLDEGLELREAGITIPILMFGPIEESTIATAIANEITMTVFTEETAYLIQKKAEELRKTAYIHLKVDSGMSRIGVRSFEEALNVMNALKSDFVKWDGIFTHFADAENLENPAFTKLQFDTFIKIVAELESENIFFNLKHCCNTAATLAFPEYHLDMIRTGISLYGYHPDPKMQSYVDLKPVMTLKTHASYIKNISAGDTVGYGRTFKAAKSTKIATIPLGYADGIPRQLSNQWALFINGHKAPVAGRICMDQIMLDVTEIESLTEEDELIFFGDPAKGYPSLYKMADITNGFHYELLCGIGKRIPRIYFSAGSVTATQNTLLD